jgi:hypothetical protein
MLSVIKQRVTLSIVMLSVVKLSGRLWQGQNTPAYFYFASVTKKKDLLP